MRGLFLDDNYPTVNEPQNKPSNKANDVSALSGNLEPVRLSSRLFYSNYIQGGPKSKPLSRIIIKSY